MPFRVTARTLLLLGAELISSDSIAFYELIKNSFDARSPRVDIDVVVRMQFEAYRRHSKNINKIISQNNESVYKIEDYKKKIIADVDLSAPYANTYANRISDATSWDRLFELIDRVNYIEFADTGCGMSANELNDVYLTIGTQSRRLEKEKQRSNFDKQSEFRPILGEKGLGRLSAMRLGWKMRIKSTKEGELNWNVLIIDWRKFIDNDNNLIEDIQVSATKGDLKENSKIKGTQIRISGLTSEWNKEKLEGIANKEFSKVTDPFTPNLRYPISLRYNDEGIHVKSLNRILFDYAHAKVNAQFKIENGEPQLVGNINYILRNCEKTFSREKLDLISTAKVSSFDPLISLGPFFG